MPTPTPAVSPPDLLRQLVRALDDKKAGDLRVLHVGVQSSITDWLVLATGNSEPHLRALRVELEKILDAAHAPIAGMDGTGPGSGWTVVDAYQIMVHLFTPEPRERYALERLWKDATEIDVRDVLAPPPVPSKPVAKQKTKPKKKAAPGRPAKKPARKSAKKTR